MREVKEKNIVLSIIFSLITCGIYMYYWMFSINEDVNALAKDDNATGGGMVILFAILTCGIYTIYWMYKMGEKCDVISGEPNGNRKWIYLILSLCGLGIVNYCLIQDTINKHSKEIINV